MAGHLNGAPQSLPKPTSRLNTPGGSPTSSMMAASSRFVRLAVSEGFSTTQLPAARAGATFHCTAQMFERQHVEAPSRQGSRKLSLQGRRALNADVAALPVGGDDSPK